MSVFLIYNVRKWIADSGKSSNFYFNIIKIMNKFIIIHNIYIV